MARTSRDAITPRGARAPQDERSPDTHAAPPTPHEQRVRESVREGVRVVLPRRPPPRPQEREVWERVRASVVRGWTTSQASRRARRWVACGLQGVARQIAAAATERRRRAGGKAKKTYRASSSSAASAPLRKAAKSNSRPTRCPRYRVPRWRRCSYLPSLALWLLLGAWLCSRLLGGALGLLVFMETYVPAGFAH